MKIEERLLTKNIYSRPGTQIRSIKKVVVHWVGNAGSTAIANRNYFESLKDKKTYASSQYIIGLDGEIILCIPETEVAYHSNAANSSSIGIENCHPDWGGKFNSKTTESLVELLADLCDRYKLNPLTDIIRHYDVTKKICPKYYVENPKAWESLKVDVKNKLNVQQQDDELITAVNKLIANDIKVNAVNWNDIKKMNMDFAQLLVERIGQKFGKTNYPDSIDCLVCKECINTREPWDNKKFKPEWVRQLIINVSKIVG